MNKENALYFICKNEIIGIKAGEKRETFLDIWMVVINDRIFARSWGFAEKSWYNCFLKDPFGQIKCGESIFNINACIPADLDDLTLSINNAYLTKYSTKQYAKPITEGKHIEKTMEFMICE